MFKLVQDKSGNMAIGFGVAIVPLLMAAGLMVDYSMVSNYRSTAQGAADAALFAAYNKSTSDLAIAKAEARKYFDSDVSDDLAGNITSFELQPTDNGFELKVTGTAPVTIMRIAGYDRTKFTVRSALEFGGGPAEIALIMDNTGSMKDHMDDLKDIAQLFVDTVAPPGAASGSAVKFALVPFVGAVNIGNDKSHEGWLDKDGDSKHHAWSIEREMWGYRDDCTPSPSDDGSGSGGGGDPDVDDSLFDDSDDRVELFLQFKNIGTGFADLFSFSSAHAAGSGYFSADDVDADVRDDCFTWIIPPQISHWDLLDDVKVKWKGCVEARPEPYDIDDTPPSKSDPDTLFVPYFWPDDSDPFATWVPAFDNNYMEDSPFLVDSDFDGRPWERSTNYLKYANHNATTDETAPDTLGPNKACGSEILPLTNNRGKVNAALSDMDYWTDSGTVMSEGLAWGWRVLSPTEPFTEGEEYGDIRKIAVLMTDGNNDVVTQQMKADDPESAPFLTHYTAYGHLRYNPRLDDDKKSIYRDYLNQRTARVCENMKAKDIELYIISFGEVSAETEAVLRKCATTPPQYYKTIKVAELSLAFGEIAAMISRPYLTK